ncbi:MAG TPA: ATP-binding protein [Acetobacteraceae bacterium]|nr:ATP-binding protein [Acetobacteraceae bacterium]
MDAARTEAFAESPKFNSWCWPRSLHGRLVLIPTALLAFGLLGTIGVILLHAKHRVAAEVMSGVQLGQDVASFALRNVSDAGSGAAALDALAHDLPRVRHVEFSLESLATGASAKSQRRIAATVHSHQGFLAPLLVPPPIRQEFPVIVRGETVGSLTVASNPADEIAEIVGEVELFSGVFIGMCLLTIGGLLTTVRSSLRPLQLLSEGFNRLEHADYRPIAAIPVIELARVGRQFNLLAASLQRVTSDNCLLIDRLFSIQDTERKELAAELHDEFGPALFAIRAEVACIMKAAAGDAETCARARSIAELTDGIQRVNYRMLERLRPLVLEHMGLDQALRQLVASWQDRCPHLAWSLNVASDCDDAPETVGLTLYRAAQEGITNAVRHAQASTIDVRLTRFRSGALLLAVQDNGSGLPQSLRYGFGLLGMMERVRRLGGSMTVSDTSPGVMVEITIPQQERRATEAAYAGAAD